MWEASQPPINTPPPTLPHFCDFPPLHLFASPCLTRYVRQIGDHQYNLWQDEKNKRGLWRRTTLEDYCKPSPTWETVLDIDELNKAEDENWVYKGATVLDLGPNEPHDIVLLKLSRGGADATVIREFNLTTKSFVENGFSIPEVRWLCPD